MFELEHESMALVMAVAISDSNRTVQYRRRELILFGVLAVQRERHEPAVRPKSSGLDQFSDRGRARRRRHRQPFPVGQKCVHLRTEHPTAVP